MRSRMDILKTCCGEALWSIDDMAKYTGKHCFCCNEKSVSQALLQGQAASAGCVWTFHSWNRWSREVISCLNAFMRLVDYRDWNNSVYSCDTLAARSTPMTSRILERLSLRKGNKVWEESASREVDPKSVGWKRWAKPSQKQQQKSLPKLLGQSSQLSQRLSTHSLLQMEAARPQIMEKRWNSAFQGLVERWVSRFRFVICVKCLAVSCQANARLSRLHKTPITWPSLSFFYLHLVQRTPWLRVFQSQFPSGKSWRAREARWQKLKKLLAKGNSHFISGCQDTSESHAEEVGKAWKTWKMHTEGMEMVRTAVFFAFLCISFAPDFTWITRLCHLHPFTWEGPKSHRCKACVVRMLRCWVRDGEAHIMLRLPRMSRLIGPDGNLATAGTWRALDV